MLDLVDKIILVRNAAVLLLNELKFETFLSNPPDLQKVVEVEMQMWFLLSNCRFISRNIKFEQTFQVFAKT